MTQPPFRCQGCDAPLPHADAVCTACDAELSAEPPAPEAKYVCPHCHQRFAALVAAPWPPHVPWWRPTTMRTQCPHCDAPLRDRYAMPPPPWLVAATIGVAIYAQLFATNWWRVLVGPVLVAAFCVPLLWSTWKIRRNADNPHRFIPGTLSFWSRGDERLQRAAWLARGKPGEPPR